MGGGDVPSWATASLVTVGWNLVGTFATTVPGFHIHTHSHRPPAQGDRSDDWRRDRNTQKVVGSAETLQPLQNGGRVAKVGRSIVGITAAGAGWRERSKVNTQKC